MLQLSWMACTKLRMSHWPSTESEYAKPVEDRFASIADHCSGDEEKAIWCQKIQLLWPRLCIYRTTVILFQFRLEGKYE